MSLSRYQPHVLGIAAAAAGVIAISFDALLVRLAETSAWNVTFWRGWLIFASLGAYQLLRGRRPRWPRDRAFATAMLVVMLLFGIDTALFVLSVSNTTVANTVVILSSSPFFAAVFSLVFLRERVRLGTWLAITAAALGVAVVFAGGARIGGSVGDALALLLAVLMGAVLTILRRFPAIGRVPVVCGSGAVAGLIAWPFASPFSLGLQSWAALGVMGLVQMPLAMVLIATATRYLPSPEVSLFLLIETVLGPVWVWLAIGEQPPTLTVYGGAAVLACVAGHSWYALRRQQRRAIPPAGHV